MSYPLVQIKRVARVVNGGTPTPAEENWNGSVLWATPVDLNKVDGGFITNTDRCLSDIGVETGSVKVPAGSVILSTRAPIGYAAVAQNAISFNQGCKALVPHRPDETDSRYLRYAIQSSVEQLQVLGKGSTFLELSTQDLGSFCVPWPSYSEQVKIADQLDRELAEIDGLIADQIRLQELLTERLTSLTFELATDASNPDRYETGHPFWKTLPKGWTLQKLGWLFKEIGSGTTPSSSDLSAYKDGVINWVTTSELREQGVSQTNKKITKTALENYSALKIHPAGSIMIAMYGATIGRLGWLDEPATVNQAVCVLSNASGILPTYAYYVMLAAKSYLISQASGGSQLNISQSTIRALPVPVPTLQKQKKIVTRLEESEQNNKKLIDNLTELRKLQKMRRLSLITRRVHNGNT